MRSSSNKNDGRVQEISEITQGLKALAKKLSCSCLLSQLSRAVEQRDDKATKLADLKGVRINRTRMPMWLCLFIEKLII